MSLISELEHVDRRPSHGWKVGLRSPPLTAVSNLLNEVADSNPNYHKKDSCSPYFGDSSDHQGPILITDRCTRTSIPKCRSVSKSKGPAILQARRPCSTSWRRFKSPLGLGTQQSQLKNLSSKSEKYQLTVKECKEKKIALEREQGAGATSLSQKLKKKTNTNKSNYKQQKILRVETPCTVVDSTSQQQNINTIDTDSDFEEDDIYANFIRERIIRQTPPLAKQSLNKVTPTLVKENSILEISCDKIKKSCFNAGLKDGCINLKEVVEPLANNPKNKGQVTPTLVREQSICEIFNNKTSLDLKGEGISEIIVPFATHSQNKVTPTLVRENSNLDIIDERKTCNDFSLKEQCMNLNEFVESKKEEKPNKRKWNNKYCPIPTLISCEENTLKSISKLSVLREFESKRLSSQDRSTGLITIKDRFKYIKGILSCEEIESNIHSMHQESIKANEILISSETSGVDNKGDISSLSFKYSKDMSDTLGNNYTSFENESDLLCNAPSNNLVTNSISHVSDNKLSNHFGKNETAIVERRPTKICLPNDFISQEVSLRENLSEDFIENKKCSDNNMKENVENQTNLLFCLDCEKQPVLVDNQDVFNNCDQPKSNDIKSIVNQPSNIDSFYGNNELTKTKNMTESTSKEGLDHNYSSSPSVKEGKKRGRPPGKSSQSKKEKKVVIPECVTIVSSDEEQEEQKSILEKANTSKDYDMDSEAETKASNSNDKLSNNTKIANRMKLKHDSNKSYTSGVEMGTPDCSIEIGCVYFGSLPCKSVTPLAVQDGKIFIELEAESEAHGEVWRHSFRLSMSPTEVTKIKLHIGRSPSMIVLLPTPKLAEDVNGSFDESILDPDSPKKANIVILPQFFFKDSQEAQEMFDNLSTHLSKIADCESISHQQAEHIILQTGQDILPDIKKNDHNTRSASKQDSGLSPEEVCTLFVYSPVSGPGRIAITNEDLACLEEGRYLNDTIIDFYLKYLFYTKLDQETREKTYIFSSYFYKRLTQQGKSGANATKNMHSQVKKWTRNVDIFNKDFILIPVNEHAHWYLVVICFPGLATCIEDCSAQKEVPPEKDDSAEEMMDTDTNSRNSSSEIETTEEEQSITDMQVEQDIELKNKCKMDEGIDINVNMDTSMENIQIDSELLSEKPMKDIPTSTAESIKHVSSIENIKSDSEILSGETVKAVIIPKVEPKIDSQTADDIKGYSDIFFDNYTDNISEPKSEPKEDAHTVVTSLKTEQSLPPVEHIKNNLEKLAENYKNNATRVKESKKGPSPCILIFDSLVTGGHVRMFINLRQYLTTEWEEKRGSTEGSKVYNKLNMKGFFPKVPMQTNDCDCGVFVLQYAESFFETPIKNYFSPIRIEDWFPNDRVSRKRHELQELIFDLTSEYEAKNDKK